MSPLCHTSVAISSEVTQLTSLNGCSYRSSSKVSIICIYFARIISDERGNYETLNLAEENIPVPHEWQVPFHSQKIERDNLLHI